MTLRRLLLVMVLVTSFPVVGAPAAHAACSATLSLEEAVAEAPIVFVGRVATVEPSRTVAGVNVVSIWKGPDLPQRIEVLGGFKGDADVRMFNIAATYMFFPTNRRPPFVADGCTATRLFSGQPLVIPPYLADDAGTSTARMPIVEAAGEDAEAEEAVLGPIIIVLGLLLGFAGLSTAFGRLMRRSPVRRHDVSEKGSPHEPRRELDSERQKRTAPRSRRFTLRDQRRGSVRRL